MDGNKIKRIQRCVQRQKTSPLKP